MNQKLLVTGSEGFVGSRTVLHFKDRGWAVTGIDLAIAREIPGVTKMPLDLRDAQAVRALEGMDFEYVIHTAADQTSKTILANNSAADENLITCLSRKKNVKGVIFMSSSLVSTSADIQYTRSKILGENRLCDSGIPFVVLRPDMIYCRDEKKMIEYSRMIQKGFAVVVGSGKYLRSPTHLDDLLAVFELVLNGNRFTNKVYEVGSPEPLTMDDIVKTLALSLGKKARLIHLPLPVAKLLFSLKGGLDVEQLATMELDRVSDLQRLKADFAYAPRTFAQGVESFKKA